MSAEYENRRYASLVQSTSLATNIQAQLNPLIPLWWSAAFPGFGHFLLGSHLMAFALVVFEFVVNNKAHINEAIYRSMIGDAAGAERVLDLQWFTGYIGVYVFAMYDSYRRAVESNKWYVLSSRYAGAESSDHLSVFSRNFPDITNPVLGLFWSLITPGLGSVFVTRLPTFLFSLVWWGVTTVQSHWFEGIYYSAIGDIDRVKAILDPQWLLFIPSIIGFAMYFSYHDTIKENLAFKRSQARYLRTYYQGTKFPKPI